MHNPLSNHYQMKLASFEVETDIGTKQRVGVYDGKKIIDVTSGHETLLARDGAANQAQVGSTEAPPNMLDFLQTWQSSVEIARQVLDEFSTTSPTTSPSGSKIKYRLDDVELLAPLPRPNSIRDCSVYEDHIIGARDIPKGTLPDAYYEYPVYYKGNPDAVVHPNDDVVWPSFTDKLDYELELAAIVGIGGRDIPPEDALDHVAGFTIFNDFSARDIQLEIKEVGLGPSKGKDFANGFGPFLVTTDSFNVSDLHLRARINGELWSEGHSGDMTHSWAEIISFISEGVDIHPGDIIGSGTVGTGCGLELDKWLQRGDTVELEVDGIGTLQHTVK